MKISKQFLIAASVFGLASCGGGGSNEGASSQPRSIPATTIIDITPEYGAAPFSTAEYLQATIGATWQYITKGASAQAAVSSYRTVLEGTTSNTIKVQDTFDGEFSESIYQKTPKGLVIISENSDFPQKVKNIIYPLVEYPSALPFNSAEHIAKREGGWGEDIDADGHEDGFRFQYSIAFKGTETLSIANTTMTVAHLTRAISLSIIPTKITNTETGSILSIEEYYARNLGMVKSVTTIKDTPGKAVAYQDTIEFTSALIGSLTWTVNGNSLDVEIPLNHSSLVFDNLRKIFYATVVMPGSGNSQIATIDPSSFSVSVNSIGVPSPSAAAVTSNSSAIYIGGSATDQLVRLSLPDFMETGRLSLPLNNFGNSNNIGSIAASPTNPNIVAVSLGTSSTVLPNQSNRVLLVDNITALPTQITGSNNRIAFSEDGTKLFSLNTDSSSFDLRSHSVNANGLITISSISTDGFFGTDRNQLSSISDQIILNDSLYADANPITITGSLNASSCTKLTSNILCFNTPRLSTDLTKGLTLISPITRQKISFIDVAPYKFNIVADSRHLVPGSGGVIAISSEPDYPAIQGTIKLVYSRDLH